ncbi:hypothetical protein O6H91_Y038100 [Diphasiastrum complanatum]|nr:hypothetical protein O6H91_Y038100 [Diphasiastrum complanatum]
MARRPNEEGEWRWLFLVGLACIVCFSIYFMLSPLFATRISADWSNGLQIAKDEVVEDISGCCKGVEHQELWGAVAKWGTDHLVNSSRECCQACKTMCGDDGPCLCNSWVYCGDQQRCGDKYRQCWLKKQEDMFSPDIQESHSEVYWTSGLVYGSKGIVALETQYGAIRLKLLPDCAPKSVAYILELLKLRHCAGCHFYRAEGRGVAWDTEGRQLTKVKPSHLFFALSCILQGIVKRKQSLFVLDLLLIISNR